MGSIRSASVSIAGQTLLVSQLGGRDPVTDGDLVTMANSNGCVTVGMDGLTLGTTPCMTGTTQQQFKLSSAGNGTFFVTYGNNCMDVYGSSMLQGGKVAGYSCGYSPNEVFLLKPLADGTWNIISQVSGLCLSSSAAGSTQQQCDATDGTQKYVLTSLYNPALMLSSASLNFAGQPVGTTSAPQTVTLSNPGMAALAIGTISIVGADAANFTSTSTCGALPTMVAVGQKCDVSITFNPSSAGPKSATLSIVDTAPGSPHSVPLMGTGSDFALSVAAGSAASQTVSSGGVATYALQVEALQGFSGAVSLSCDGVPPSASCNVTPGSVSAPGTFTVTVNTNSGATAAAAWRAPRPPTPLVLPWLVLLLAIWGLSMGQRRVRGRVFAPVLRVVLAVFLLGQQACGAPPSTSTPSGSYTLTVTGKSNSTTHSLPLTLVVQ